MREPTLAPGVQSKGGDPPESIAEQAVRQGRKWAIIIAVNETADPKNYTPLPFCQNDANLLYETLRDECDYSEDSILLLHDGSDEPTLQPTSDNLEIRIAEHLARAGAEDTVLVYFSGHGLPAGDQQSVFFATSNCRKSKLAETAYDLSHIRNLLNEGTACAARQKLLILDICHAGRKRGELDQTDLQQALEKIYQSARGFVTIASSKLTQSSYDFPEKEQGIFSYYLVEALLHQNADGDRDGFLDTDELFKYIAPRVSVTAKQVAKADQDPEIIKDDVAFAISQSKLPSDVKELVRQKRTAMFRVEQFKNGDWKLAGAAFAIHRDRNRIFLLTAASVVTNNNGHELDKQNFRLLNELNPRFHLPLSRVHLGSTVNKNAAIIEVEFSDDLNLPECFRLAPTSATGLTTKCAYLRYLNQACKATTACYREAEITAVPIAPHGALRFRPLSNRRDVLAGAPLFVVSTNSPDGRSNMYEQVIGICLDVQDGDGFSALPADSLRDFIELTRASTGASLPLDLTREVVTDDDGRQRIIRQTTRPTSMDLVIHDAIEFCKKGDFARARKIIEEQRRQFAKQQRQDNATSVDVPWEFEALEGSVLTRSGLASLRNDRIEARNLFRTAQSRLASAVATSGGHLLVLLLEGRARNNLYTPANPNSLTPDERRELKIVHDRASRLLKGHADGQRLTNLERAQWEYMLGYTHLFLNDSVDPVTNFRNSYGLYPSRTAAHRLMLLKAPVTQAVDDLPDLFANEFDVLLNSWLERGDTECSTCNDVCESCM